MTPAELALPWRTYALEGYAPWRIVVERGDREIPLGSSEVLALCAAVELERVHASDIDALLSARRRAREPWTFDLIVGNAPGLKFESAPGEMALGEVLRLVGLEVVRSEVRMENAQEGRKAA